MYSRESCSKFAKHKHVEKFYPALFGMSENVSECVFLSNSIVKSLRIQWSKSLESYLSLRIYKGRNADSFISTWIILTN